MHQHRKRQFNYLAQMITFSSVSSLQNMEKPTFYDLLSNLHLKSVIHEYHTQLFIVILDNSQHYSDF